MRLKTHIVLAESTRQSCTQDITIFDNGNDLDPLPVEGCRSLHNSASHAPTQNIVDVFVRTDTLPVVCLNARIVAKCDYFLPCAKYLSDHSLFLRSTILTMFGKFRWRRVESRNCVQKMNLARIWMSSHTGAKFWIPFWDFSRRQSEYARINLSKLGIRK